MAMSPQAVLAAGRIYLRKQLPYFTVSVMSLIPKEAPGLGTFGVSERSVMLWDPAFVVQMQAKHGDIKATQQCGGLVLHETFHILLNHAGRARAIGAEPRLWNIAADMEINHRLRSSSITLPDDGVYPETYGLEPGGLAETYYYQLRDLPEMAAKARGGQAGGAGGEGQGQEPGPAQGRCGSGAGGLPLDGEDHEGQGRSEADRERCRRQTAEAISGHIAQHGRGSVPGGWDVWADELVKPPKIRWQDKLARILRQSVAYQAGLSDYSYHRPSRRQSAMGYGRGHVVMPAMRSPKPKVAVGVDTSGSMGDAQISRAVAETAGILAATTSDVDFLACDAEVHSIVKVRHYRQLRQALKGGGGTSFVPVFHAVSELRSRPGVFVFITDGCGPAPAEPPTGIDVIWVLVGPYKQKPYVDDVGAPVAWGTFIEVDDD